MDEVFSSNPQTQEIQQVRAVLLLPACGASREKKQTFWHATRRPSGRIGRRGDGDLHLAGGSFRQAGAARRGRAHGPLHLHQPRPARRCRSAASGATSNWRAPPRSSASWRCASRRRRCVRPGRQGAAVAADFAAVAQLPVAGGGGQGGLAGDSAAVQFHRFHVSGEADRRHPAGWPAASISRAWFRRTASASCAAPGWRWSSTRSSSSAAACTCSRACWSIFWACTRR